MIGSLRSSHYLESRFATRWTIGMFHSRRTHPTLGRLLCNSRQAIQRHHECSIHDELIPHSDDSYAIRDKQSNAIMNHSIYNVFLFINLVIRQSTVASPPLHIFNSNSFDHLCTISIPSAALPVFTISPRRVSLRYDPGSFVNSVTTTPWTANPAKSRPTSTGDQVWLYRQWKGLRSILSPPARKSGLCCPVPKTYSRSEAQGEFRRLGTSDVTQGWTLIVEARCTRREEQLHCVELKILMI
ncbi:hypothetical protein RSAG8_12055, partial [Rhizoctonia solani AG-8 WAC10335]